MIKVHQNGNAMVYILIAVALFGALTLTLSRQNDSADGQNLDDELVDLYATEILQYAAIARNSVDQMIFSGIDISEIDFVNPTEAAFNTGSNAHKIFHPHGGGLNYQNDIRDDIANGATSQWAINNSNNVEWTQTTAVDAILTAYFINRDVCAKINEIITGDNAIPATSNPHEDYFLSTGARDLHTTECSGCDGNSTLCVENDSADNYSFYSIIAAQ